MSDKIIRENFKYHENQEIQDIVIDMDITKNKEGEEPNKELTTNKLQNENTISNTFTTNLKSRDCEKTSRLQIIDNAPKIDKFEIINENKREKINIDDKDKYIRVRVYDTYFGQQHYQPQQSQWYVGGFGQNNAPAEFVYDPSTRNAFVKFVMIIVLIMIIITVAFIAFVIATDDVKEFFETHGTLLMIPAVIILLICHYAMMCSPCARVPPCNFIFLTITVIATSVISATISAYYRTEIVLYAAIATAAVVFVCVLLACSSFDFTSWMLYLVVISTAFSVIALIVLTTMLVTGHVMKPLIIIILVVATLIEVVILTTELQMILGGRSIELSEDDYALGAYMLYTSIMSLFMKLVQLIGFADN